jgi:CheY-like chemotaxis protein
VNGRILVVDDLPDVRATICGLLEDAGYSTRSAKSREEALIILQNERFHIAVLDVRLDESDEDNQDGMDLLRDINQYDASMAIIVLTGYANVDIVRAALQPVKGVQPAYSLLLKNEMLNLPEKVYSAFTEALKLNLNLEIDDPEQCIEKLAEIIRFRSEIRPDKKEIAEQIREVFGKLFYECDQIRVRQMQQGFSGAAVFQVTPHYQAKGQGENVVVKVGNKTEMNMEKEQYEQYVRGIVGGHRIPEAIQSASARHISGILYSFIGLGGQTENFATYYRTAKIEAINAVLDNLYQNTLFPQKQRTGRLKPGVDLREFYTRHLHLDETKFKKVEDRTTGNKHAFSRGSQGEILLGGTPITDPLQHVRQANFHADGFFTTIHGDLNGQNILLDPHHEAWLIDFATTTDDGHVLQDYATMENNIRFILHNLNETGLLFQWARASLAKNLLDPADPPEIQNNPELLKAHQAIRRIRVMASKTPHYSPRAYLTALFFNALRLTTFNDASVTIRDHAFYCASVIAERLSKGTAYV